MSETTSRDGREEGPPRELVVDAKPAPGDASDGSGSAMAPIVLTVLAAGGLAKFVTPLAGLAALVIGVVWIVAQRKPNRGRFVLRVDDGILEIDREKKKRGDVATRVPLADVLDVTLDRKTQASGGRGGTTERVCIALEVRGATVLVPDDRVTPIEAQEWYGRIRVFLRKHGWAPPTEEPR